jgi:hypothetical protein
LDFGLKGCVVLISGKVDQILSRLKLIIDPGKQESLSWGNLGVETVDRFEVPFCCLENYPNGEDPSILTRKVDTVDSKVNSQLRSQ